MYYRSDGHKKLTPKESSYNYVRVGKEGPEDGVGRLTRGMEVREKRGEVKRKTTVSNDRVYVYTELQYQDEF